MDLREQKYVCALAQYQNLTRAAEKLFISQPALSMFISKLETRLGVPLFQRRNGRFFLAYAGERYVCQAQKMLEAEKEFLQELEHLVSRRAGRLRIGASVRRSPWLIPPVIAQLREENPMVEVELREGPIADLNDLMDHCELDFMVVSRSDVREDMDYQVLFQDKFLLMVPQIHPLNEQAEYVPGKKYRHINAACLEGQTVFVHGQWTSNRQTEEKILQRSGVKPARTPVIRGTETTLQMVAEGLGLGFIRESYARNLTYCKPVNFYTIGDEDCSVDVVACYRPDLEQPAYMKRALELLAQQGKNSR